MKNVDFEAWKACCTCPECNNSYDIRWNDVVKKFHCDGYRKTFGIPSQIQVQFLETGGEYLLSFFDIAKAKGFPYFMTDIDGPEIAINPRIETFVVCPNCGNKIAIDVPPYIIEKINFTF